MPTLRLLRGLSGSGKSTVAREYCASEDDLVISTDDFFTDKEGNYVFDFAKLSDAHDYSRERAIRAMMDDVDHIIIDNTNTRWWEMMPYLVQARIYGYDVETVMVGSLEPLEVLEEYAARNKHGTPLEIIQRQASHFERLMDPAHGFFLESMRQQIVDELQR